MIMHGLRASSDNKTGLVLMHGLRAISDHETRGKES